MLDSVLNGSALVPWVDSSVPGGRSQFNGILITGELAHRLEGTWHNLAHCIISYLSLAPLIRAADIK